VTLWLIAKYRYKGVIQVTVGEGDKLQTFHVHEDLLTARSPFFKKALSGNWKEAQDRLVKLPEDDPVTFQRYVHLLYTDALVIEAEEVSEPSKSTEYPHLGLLYVLAEKLQDIDAKNVVLEATLLASRREHADGIRYFPGNDMICLIYAGTGPGSPMRNLLVNFYAYQGEGEWLKREGEEWPSDITRELAIQLLDKPKRPNDPTRTGDASKYMEVNDGDGH
jgi:hypothetical protein